MNGVRARHRGPGAALFAAIGCACGSPRPSPHPAPTPLAWKTPAPAAAGAAQETRIGGFDLEGNVPIVFSPRGDRAAVRMSVQAQVGYGQPSTEVEQYVVVVSAAGAERGPGYRLISDPLFSPDGSRLVYVAIAHDQRAYVVTDAGTQGPWADAAYPSFGPRGDLAFTAREQDGGEHLVVEGRWGPAFDQAEYPQFSPDGSKTAYLAQRGRDWHVVIGDQVGPAFEQVGIPRFSADGSRIGYTGRRDGHDVLVVDGVVQVLPEGAEYVVLSPDLARLLYQKRGGGKRTLYLDGRMVASWDDVVSGGMPVFSPGGETFAFVEWHAGTCAAVVADTRGRRLHEGRRFRSIEQLYFAPRGGVLAYVGCDDDGCRMMWGDREGAQLVGASEPVFSPDGRTLAYLAWPANQGVHVVVGEQSYGPYELAGAPTFSSDGSQVAWGIRRGQELRWVVVAIAPLLDGGRQVTTSSGGRPPGSPGRRSRPTSPRAAGRPPA